MPFDVFVTYSGMRGASFAKAAASTLWDVFYLQAGRHQSAADPDEETDEATRKALAGSRAQLVILTPEALESKRVQKEVSLGSELRKKVVCYRDSRVTDDRLTGALASLRPQTFHSTKDLTAKLSSSDRWGIPVIIPTAGGEAGISPLNLLIPKTMLPVAGKPILHHILDSLATAPEAFSAVVMLVGRNREVIEYWASLFPGKLPVRCVEAQVNTLPAALKRLRLKTSFLLYFSDILLEDEISWTKVLADHRHLRDHHKVIGTLLASRAYQLDIGTITPAAQGLALIKGFSEKPPTLLHDLANLGVSVFEPGFVPYLHNSDESVFGDSLMRAVKAGQEFGYYTHSRWHHIQTIGAWLAANDAYAKHQGS
ncbi:MAG: hypothetical protein HY303_22330 [Candidatus Wallbacteria bacterium]|nr:hypothetical protein [Candidatus Wallbacteria bacterium]